jgi:hypothetical protein
MKKQYTDKQLNKIIHEEALLLIKENREKIIQRAMKRLKAEGYSDKKTP